VLARTPASDDCAALAGAFALVARAHFLELGFVRPSGPAAPFGAAPSGSASSTSARAPRGGRSTRAWALGSRPSWRPVTAARRFVVASGSRR
jgi:hypothetical protein